MWDIGSGLSALFGAIVGGGVTLFGTWLTLRASREERHEKRISELTDRQIARHEQLIVDLYALDDTSRRMLDHLLGDSIDDQANIEYESSWVKSNISRAQARFAGPPELHHTLVHALEVSKDFVNAIDKWRDDGAALTPEQVSDLQRQYRQARNEYIEAASQILMPRAQSY
ncbi:hypothetical protein ACPXB3_21060 [Gordonia sp. DT219]|uniref:hypothetical protein n=1 Tax=Gordonia sp. DT219 TaxID=3416658 RepID=UPI003CEA0375